MSDNTDPTPIATTEQFKRALFAIRDREGINQKDLAMLQAQLRAPAHTITATRLAHEAGLANYALANLQYGKFAHAVADRLGYAPPKRPDGTTRWWFTLSLGRDGSEETVDGHAEWTMRPELVQALQEMRLA
jgi:hypothetical protein